MKKAVLGFLGLMALAVGALAQPTLCTVTGTLYTSTGAVCSGCTLTISKARQGSTPLTAPPQAVRADANGAISFTAVQGSFLTVTGQFTIGRYNFAQGLELYIPLQASANLTGLQTAEDALNSLIGTTNYARADEPLITKTPSGNLSNEFALSSLATGLLKNTNGTGIPTIAAPGTDYESPLTFAARLTRSTNTIDLANSGVAPGSYTAANITVDTYGRITAASNGSAGAGIWGSITGSLSNQTDLNAALNAKAPLVSPGFSGQPTAPSIGRLAASGTDQPGSDFAVYGGAGTGVGLTGDLRFQLAGTSTSGSTANSFVDRQIITKRKPLTQATNVNLLTISLPSLAGASGFLDYTAYATNGTDVQIRRGVIAFSTINKAGVYTSETSIADEALNASAGTLSCGFSFQPGSNQTTLRVNCQSSLIPTNFYFIYQVRNQSEQPITIN